MASAGPTNAQIKPVSTDNQHLQANNTHTSRASSHHKVLNDYWSDYNKIRYATYVLDPP